MNAPSAHNRAILFLFLTLVVTPPAGAFFEFNALCPDEVGGATAPGIDIELRSQTADLIEVYLSAGYLAQGDSTLFGRTLIGPNTAAPSQSLSAFEARSVALANPPTLPASPPGGVVEFFVWARAEAVGGVSASQIDACLITLPEPTLSTGLTLAILGLASTRRVRQAPKRS